MKETLSCRVVNGLGKAVKKRAEDEGRNVNDILIEALNKEFDNSPEVINSNIKVDTTEVIQRIQILKLKVKELYSSEDAGFLGLFPDRDVRACIKAIKVEIKQLVDSLPKPSEMDDDDDDDYWK